MSMVRLLHLPWLPLFATAVVLWVVGEPMLARKSSIFPPAARASQAASAEPAEEADRMFLGKASRITNYAIGEPVAL